MAGKGSAETQLTCKRGFVSPRGTGQGERPQPEALRVEGEASLLPGWTRGCGAHGPPPHPPACSSLGFLTQKSAEKP